MLSIQLHSYLIIRERGLKTPVMLSYMLKISVKKYPSVSHQVTTQSFVVNDKITFVRWKFL